MAPIAPRMPFYPPGVPGMGQQIMYGQAPPAFISQVITQKLLILFVTLSHCKKKIVSNYKSIYNTNKTLVFLFLS
jgi:hypothetical protein